MGKGGCVVVSNIAFQEALAVEIAGLKNVFLGLSVFNPNKIGLIGIGSRLMAGTRWMVTSNGGGSAKLMNQATCSTKCQHPYLPIVAMLLVCFSIAILQPSPCAAQMEGMDTGPVPKKEKAAETKEPDTVPRISLGEITASPGASLMMPLYYTPDPQKPLRALTVDIDYVSNHLKFQKASRGVIPEEVNADINAKATEGAPDTKGTIRSKLRVSVALTDKNPKQGLPEGLLTFLLFQITMDAKPFAIKLNPEVVSAEDLRSKKMAEITTAPGTVLVELPDVLPEATCFFFSH